MELNDWLTILGALGGFEAIKWMVNFYVNRKTDARKEDASADSMEDENERKQVDWLEDRIAQRDTKIDAIYVYYSEKGYVPTLSYIDDELFKLYEEYVDAL